MQESFVATDVRSPGGEAGPVLSFAEITGGGDLAASLTLRTDPGKVGREAVRLEYGRPDNACHGWEIRGVELGDDRLVVRFEPGAGVRGDDADLDELFVWFTLSTERLREVRGALSEIFAESELLRYRGSRLPRPEKEPREADASRLARCGWDSFRPELFLDEPGRRSRDVHRDFARLVRDHAPGPKILELCCGSGRLLTALAAEGFEVVGLDLSAPMLDVGRAAVAKLDEAVRKRIRLVQGDMCSFDLGETFDFVILEDDGFVYLLTREDQLSCLRAIRAHLSDRGRLFLNFATPLIELADPSPFEYDPESQIKMRRCSWSRADGTEVREGFERRRLTWPSELESLLETAGLEPVERWGDLARSPFRDAARQEYHFLIRRRPGGVPDPREAP